MTTTIDPVQRSTNGHAAALAQPAAPDSHSAPLPPSALRRLLGGLPLSIIVGAALWISLVVAAGPWNILANTRVLDLLINAGIIQLTDADAGFIEGLPDPSYYLASQDPVDWPVVAIVMAIFGLFWWLKSIQFHQIARHHGTSTSYGKNARAYLHGLSYERTLPWGFGEAAGVAQLEAEGVEPRRAHSILFLANVFIIFEIAAFAIYGLFDLGWAAWFSQLFWALIICAGFFLWSRAPKADRVRQPGKWPAATWHLRALLQKPGRLLGLSALSLLAFALEDVAAYFVAQAFTSSNVILNVDFSILLMGVVGSYIARLVRFTPGGIGQFEWGFAAALYLGGVGLPEAATIAILDNFFRYATLGIVYLGMRFWPGVRATFEDVGRVLVGGLAATKSAVNGAIAHGVQSHGAASHDAASHDAGGVLTRIPSVLVPAVPAPYVPPAAVVWRRVLLVAWLALIYFFDRFTVLLADFWMLQSLQLESIFWTNFRTGALLFGAAFAGFFLAVSLPAFAHRLKRGQRSLVMQAAVQIGLFAGLQLAGRYLTYLTFTGQSFSQKDPIFGLDYSFYIFTLPALQLTTAVVLLGAIVMFISSLICASIARGYARQNGSDTDDSDTDDSDMDGSAEAAHSNSDALRWLGGIATPVTLMTVLIMGVASAVFVWLSRFDLLYKDNSHSALPTGADFLDVTGLFSTLNQIGVTSVVILAATVATMLLLSALRRADREAPAGVPVAWTGRVRFLGNALVLLIALDFAFAGAVYVRDLVAVRPNEPVVQLPYIQHHLDATRSAYRLEEIEAVDFVPKAKGDPLPAAADLLESPVLRNAPLWPGYASYLESLLDPQHSQRILQTGGDNMIYGPTLEIFRQQQKLRTYYNFMDVDPLRFTEDGETNVYVSSVRELPLLDPQPWLTWWGQRFLLFTHGYGLVTAPMGQMTDDGAPVFTSSSIPVQAAQPAFDVENPRVYFGEGSVTMAISNIENMKEFDFPTEQGRAENVLTDMGEIGVAVDSPLKRLVFGWRSGQFFEMVFSRLITEETRLQYYRTPLVRLQRIAPFLYFDSNIYAVPTADELVWLVNGMATTDHYPYSKHEYLGNKSVSRSAEAPATRRVNYVEDAVKVTVSASDGTVRAYKIGDGPIVETWARVYPDIFIDAVNDPGAMPEEVRQQLTYPMQLFHIQFDDIYNIYHMDEAVYFFNMEDMWDDGDEVLGPILDEGESITFSIEPYQVLLETGGALPASSRETQFSLAAVFTPENALNLRAVPLVYQDGDDYGKLSVLQVPKGTFVMGPEQADAAIDQDPKIAQQISLWNRQGTEVIRGHTSLLVVDGELLYIEPLFIRSQQNPVTQLKQVVVVFRGQPYMADTLEAAIRAAVGESADGTMAVADQS